MTLKPNLFKFSNIMFESNDILDNTADILDLNHSDDNIDLEYDNNELDSLTDVEDDFQSENDQLVENGILSIDMIKKGLSNLGKTPDGLTYAMLDVNLVALKLADASSLCSYSRLQNIDVSHNVLESVDFIDEMQHLIKINGSHNRLTNVLEQPVQCGEFLREIDFSFNQIENFPSDFSGFCFLSRLNFDGNKLVDISALSSCQRLTHLNIAHNAINSLEPLLQCSLRFLDASFNSLSSLSGLEVSVKLQELLVAGNQIRSMEPLSGGSHVGLHRLDLDSNGLVDIEHLQPLQSLPLLRELDLRNNPIGEVPEYRLRVLLALNRLCTLDGSRVDVEEKVRAHNTFRPSMELTAARDHRINMVNRFFRTQTVLYSTLQNSYTPYPMLVLVGPKGSGKKWLARKLVQEIPNFFGLAISHTDQDRGSNTTDDPELLATERADDDKPTARGDLFKMNSYVHVSTEEFNSMRIKGRFLETCSIDGHQYGLTVDAVEDIAREGLACVLDMGLEGVRSLKKTHFEPRYVLTLALDRQIQEARIRARAISPVGLDCIVCNAARRAETYVEVHRNNAGYFDKFICTDNLEEAFINLKRLVMDYLGITNELVTDSRILDANSRLASIGNLTHSRATESQPKVSSGESVYSNRDGDNICQRSLQRRLNTAKAAIFRKANEDTMSTAKKTISRARSCDATGMPDTVDHNDCVDDCASSSLSNQESGSDLSYRSPEADSRENNSENDGAEFDSLRLVNHSSSSTNRSLTAKAPRDTAVAS